MRGGYVKDNVIAVKAVPYRDDIYVITPRMKQGVMATLWLIIREKNSVELQPYPELRDHKLSDCNAIQNAVDFYLDHLGKLWILDTGIIDTLSNPQCTCPPKVVVVNLLLGKLIKRIDISSLMEANSLLQNIVVEYALGGNAFIYASDASRGAILVHEVSTGAGWSVVTCGPATGLQITLVKRMTHAVLLLVRLHYPGIIELDTTTLRRKDSLNPLTVFGEHSKPVVLLGADSFHVYLRHTECSDVLRYMPVVKTLGLWSLPDILVIHLKRFRQQAKGRTSTKLTAMVEFPLNDFDMTPHLVRRNMQVAESPGHSRSPRRRHSKTPATNPHENMYDLYAICYHHGDDLETGHYTAACKNPYDGHWYKFDDSKVTPVDDENAYSELVDNTAYMLFYKRKKPTVTHSCSSDDQHGHWALRMPKYVKRTTETVNELTEVKEESVIEEVKIEPPANEPDSESDITAPTHSPSLSRSVASLPDDSISEVTSPVKHTVCVTVIHNPSSVVQSPTLQRPLIVEVNGNSRNSAADDTSENETSVSLEPYIHKDVHVNPKMTPVDTRRPRSVDYPTRSSGPTPTTRDTNRNYESSPLVASINEVEYHPTTEDLMLSMFQESKFIVPRHTNHVTGESHRAG
uniref:ubiquitinyl hydrolase 1 n=1 Tax=Heliothis virescens TaxID=7102 RepID=A0A2A4JAJ6_HELVI